MKPIVEFISQPWPWYVAGPMISIVMFFLLYFGKSLGISSNFRTMCSMLGAGKNCNFFDFDWKKQKWNLAFAIGLFLGGFITNTFLMNDHTVHISQKTINELTNLGLDNPGSSYVPSEIFSWSSLLSLKGIILLIVGGFLVGFGTRYAGGCTSGHAISGLSNLQLPSLIAVIGFFIGGLLSTHFLLPYLLSL